MLTDRKAQTTAGAVLVTFANGSYAGAVVPSGQIFDRLMMLKLWYLPRQLPSAALDLSMLFYEARVGFRGFATIKNTSIIGAGDRALLAELGIPFLRFRVELERLVVFDNAVPAAPHVESLSFVSNKKHWGHSFSASPRLIPYEDFQHVVRLGSGRK